VMGSCWECAIRTMIVNVNHPLVSQGTHPLTTNKFFSRKSTQYFILVCISWLGNLPIGIYDWNC
ncbi:MAG: hypothetical protein ACPGSF_01955, partial [Flavobacteriaceae bacterium]